MLASVLTLIRYGNRGHNIPCRLLGTKRTFMTSQNHGYAVLVDDDNVNVKSLFQNINDGTNEGLYWPDRKWFSVRKQSLQELVGSYFSQVQFHPEARSGPTDTMGLFNAFAELIKSEAPISTYRVICDSLGVANVEVKLVESRRKVLVLGSGGLSIGQSGEFDYSGSQAIKAYANSVCVNCC